MRKSGPTLGYSVLVFSVWSIVFWLGLYYLIAVGG